jgi:hypothetical protein
MLDREKQRLHTLEQLVLEPSSFEVETGMEKLKRHK